MEFYCLNIKCVRGRLLYCVPLFSATTVRSSDVLILGLNIILFQANIHLQHTNKIWHKDLIVSHLTCKRRLLKQCSIQYY